MIENTKKEYGLLGKSLVHSYSGEIHESLGEYKYRLNSISEQEIAGFISGYNFGGLNVTIPYKQVVMSYCDEITPLAREIGSVNTIYKNDGRITGHNTDYEGFIYGAHRAGIDFTGKKIAVLGSGGTSLMVNKASRNMGAEKITVVTRNPELNGVLNDSGYFSPPEAMISYEELKNIADTVEIIINTTPVGTYPDNGRSLISLEGFSACEAVIDVIYNPGKTELLLQAEELGIKYTNGLPMLVSQATAAAGYFLGEPGAFTTENERIINRLSHKMMNIILIGMPGSGKSTLGQMLSEKTGRDFFDMDVEIAKAAGMSVKKIFDAEGEPGFRKREREIASSLGRRHGLVIASGGGAVLYKENIHALRQNGYVILIKRPVEKLAREGRPLSVDVDALKRMEIERMSAYEAASDISFDNSSDVIDDKVADNMLRLINF